MEIRGGEDGSKKRGETGGNREKLKKFIIEVEKKRRKRDGRDREGLRETE